MDGTDTGGAEVFSSPDVFEGGGGGAYADFCSLSKNRNLHNRCLSRSSAPVECVDSVDGEACFFR